MTTRRFVTAVLQMYFMWIILLLGGYYSFSQETRSNFSQHFGSYENLPQERKKLFQAADLKINGTKDD